MLYKEGMENLKALHFVLDADLTGRVDEYRYENCLSSATPKPTRKDAPPAKKEAK
jgi:hypothetical protein